MEQKPPVPGIARIYNYEIIDSRRHATGIVEGLWVEPTTNELEFIGVKTGPLGHLMHLVPASGMLVQDDTRAVEVPYTAAQIHEAPTFELHHALTAKDRREIMRHYQRTSADGETSATS